MKNKIQKFIRLLPLIVIIAVIGVRVANTVRFELAKPTDANAYNYIGTWGSESVPLVKGRIIANIPYPLPEGKPFKVETYVYYNITSLFRAGKFVPMDMEGFVQSSGEASGSNSESPIVLPPRITFKFKGGPGGKQTVDYVSTSDSKFTQVVGGYRSQSPHDLGKFSIKKVK